MVEPTQADRDAWEIYGPAIFNCGMTGPEALARHRLASTPASGEVVAWMYYAEDGQEATAPLKNRLVPNTMGWTEAPLYAAPSHPAADLVTILHQYRSDMMHPPAPDSRERRVAMIDAAIAKFGRDA